MTGPAASTVAQVTNGVHEFYGNLAAGGFVNELCLSQARLADHLGLSRGTVRNWSSSGRIGRLFRRRLAELCLHQRHVSYMWATALRMKRVLDGDPLGLIAQRRVNLQRGHHTIRHGHGGGANGQVLGVGFGRRALGEGADAAQGKQESNAN